MKRRGFAVWQGDLKSGVGTVSTESGILTAIPYSFINRFEKGTGTNPEELIAAAHWRGDQCQRLPMFQKSASSV